MNLSVVILTLNEAANLPGALASVAGCGDVVVLDSGSTDATVRIAREGGARVLTRPFDSFAGQRNHILDTVDTSSRWVFFLDADERFTPGLRDECESVVREDSRSGYMAAPRMILGGRWIRHASQYPVYQLRLVKRGELRFVQSGHGQREGDAKRGIGHLRQPYEHHFLSKGVAEWMERHNRYAAAEASGILQDTAPRMRLLRILFVRDPVARRRELKRWAGDCQVRPALRFLHLYLLSGGFLDGYPGFAYCRMMLLYELMIRVHLDGLRRLQSG